MRWKFRVGFRCHEATICCIYVQQRDATLYTQSIKSLGHRYIHTHNRNFPIILESSNIACQLNQKLRSHSAVEPQIYIIPKGVNGEIVFVYLMDNVSRQYSVYSVYTERFYYVAEGLFYGLSMLSTCKTGDVCGVITSVEPILVW